MIQSEEEYQEKCKRLENLTDTLKDYIETNMVQQETKVILQNKLLSNMDMKKT